MEGARGSERGCRASGQAHADGQAAGWSLFRQYWEASGKPCPAAARGRTSSPSSRPSSMRSRRGSRLIIIIATVATGGGSGRGVAGLRRGGQAGKRWGASSDRHRMQPCWTSACPLVGRTYSWEVVLEWVRRAYDRMLVDVGVSPAPPTCGQQSAVLFRGKRGEAATRAAGRQAARTMRNACMHAPPLHEQAVVVRTRAEQGSSHRGTPRRQRLIPELPVHLALNEPLCEVEAHSGGRWHGVGSLAMACGCGVEP